MHAINRYNCNNVAMTGVFHMSLELLNYGIVRRGIVNR